MNQNNGITLEWEIIPGQTEQLNQKIKSLTDLLIPTYVEQEVEFARQKPQEVTNDFMLKSLAPMLQTENVDWNLFEMKTKDILEQFFKNMDWSKHSKKEDINIFVTAKDQETGQNLGVIQFYISPDFAQDNVKAALFGILTSAQNSELEKQLMFSIFQIRPETKRLFLHTRSTNKKVIQNYKGWGFVEFEGKLPNWIDLEYLVKD